MRILMVAPQPFFTPRGTPFSILYRLRALSALGHQVDLITYPFGIDPGVPGVSIFRIPRPPGLKSVRIGPSPAKLLLDLLLLVKVLHQAQVRHYDMIHTHEEAGLVGSFLSCVTGVPHLYDMHSSLPQQFNNLDVYNVRPVITLFRLLERAILAGSQGVIAICPALMTHLSRCQFSRPYRLIENSYTDAVDKPAAAHRSQVLRARHRLQGCRIVLYTGTLEAYQGLDLLLEAMTSPALSEPHLRFVIVGGRPDQLQELSARAWQRGLSERLLLVGQVPPQEIPAWFQLAELLVSPRISGTNTPLKIYQYLKSGVPLVATQIPSHTQILDASVCRLVPPDGEALAAGLADLLAHPRRAAGLAAAARRLARAEYSNEKYILKVSACLGSMWGREEKRAVMAGN